MGFEKTLKALIRSMQVSYLRKGDIVEGSNVYDKLGYELNFVI